MNANRNINNRNRTNNNGDKMNENSEDDQSPEECQKYSIKIVINNNNDKTKQ